MKTFVILALAGLMSMANAQSPTGDPQGPGKGRNLESIPGLDDATAAKIEQLRTEHMKSVIALRAKTKSAQVDFRSMMRKDNPDESAILSKQKEISSMKGELAASQLKHRFAVMKLLTPEQQKFFQERRGRGIGEGRGKGMRGRGFRDGHGRRQARHLRDGSGPGDCCR